MNLLLQISNIDTELVFHFRFLKKKREKQSFYPKKFQKKKSLKKINLIEPNCKKKNPNMKGIRPD